MMADGALQAFQAQTKGDTFYVQLVGRLRVGRQVNGGDKKGDGDVDRNEGSGEEMVSYDYFFPSFLFSPPFGALSLINAISSTMDTHSLWNFY